MRLTLRASCSDGNCPTIYEDTETGDFVVQGYVLRDEGTPPEVRNLPAGEAVVRVPREVMLQLARQMEEGAGR